MFLQMSIVNDNYVSEIPKESEAIIVKIDDKLQARLLFSPLPES